MGVSSTTFPECCRYCPHRTPVSGACGHAARQTLVAEFARAGDSETTCPVFADWRTDEMAALSDHLE